MRLTIEVEIDATSPQYMDAPATAILAILEDNKQLFANAINSPHSEVGYMQDKQKRVVGTYSCKEKDKASDVIREEQTFRVAERFAHGLATGWLRRETEDTLSLDDRESLFAWLKKEDLWAWECTGSVDAGITTCAISNELVDTCIVTYRRMG